MPMLLFDGLTGKLMLSLLRLGRRNKSLSVARIMRKFNHVVFYLDVQRVRRGYYEATFKLISQEPQQLEEFKLTDIYYQLLEESIRRTPAYWLWSHNRWSRTREEFDKRFEVINGKVVSKFTEITK